MRVNLPAAVEGVADTCTSACQHGCVHVGVFRSLHCRRACVMRTHERCRRLFTSSSDGELCHGLLLLMEPPQLPSTAQRRGNTRSTYVIQGPFWKRVVNVCHGACGPQRAPNVTTAHAAVIHSVSLVVDSTRASQLLPSPTSSLALTHRDCGQTCMPCGGIKERNKQRERESERIKKTNKQRNRCLRFLFCV